MKKALLISGFLILSACSINEADFKSEVEAIPLDDVRRTDSTETVEKIPEPLPNSINLDVPFYPQAPDADWSMPWQEVCEEASIILAYYYVTGQDLTKEKFKEEVLSLVDWQIENFGDYEHTNIEQTAEMLEKFFKYSDYEILKNPTADDLKKALAKGRAIVAPFASRQLGNPFYSGEGPYYHMMVIKGYD